MVKHAGRASHAVHPAVSPCVALLFLVAAPPVLASQQPVIAPYRPAADGGPVSAVSQSDVSLRPQGTTREALIRAEDARGGGPDSLQPLLAGLRDPALRLLAIRAVGRLERADLTDRILPFLDEPAAREAAAEAVAQSMRGLASRPASPLKTARVDSVFAILAAHARTETSPEVLGALAQSLARLPFDDARQARAAETVLVELVTPDGGNARRLPAAEGVAHGLYTLARARRTLGEPSPVALAWLRQAATYRDGLPDAAAVRRVAWMALNAARPGEELPLRAGSGDPDPQVRRLVLQALPNVSDTALRNVLVRQAARDPDPMVRVDWVAAHRLVLPQDCEPLLAAAHDVNPHVALAAIDALSGPCPARLAVADTLGRLITAGPPPAIRRAASGVSWHAEAHALVTLARVDSAAARPLVWRDAAHPVWQVRMYAARAATVLRDSAVLGRLAFDPVGSVREVALGGLSATVSHLADLVYARALASPDYHVVLAAARALKGAPMPDSILPSVLMALERLHAERRQTSRDPRLELLSRVDEWADARVVSSLGRLLEDVDPLVAARVREIMRRLQPQQDAVTVVPGPDERVPVALEPVRVRVTMSPAAGGGSFDVLLDARNAPVTVGRVVALIRNRYYDGLSFHRVVPNFVLQGGSPGMNEYVGIGPFMRDELSLAHHARGTVGISTRGRDTGDGQWFINLVDNYRLDHEYTVFASIVSGMDVVDRILEGDVMATVRVLPGR